MPKQTTSEPQVFEQSEDARGRLVLDRAFTPEEAQQQDADHQAQTAENRQAALARRRSRSTTRRRG